LLLHLVDIAPVDESEPADAVAAIQRELAKFSAELAAKPRWLIINKIDLLAEHDLANARSALLKNLDWQGPAFEVSAATGRGTTELAQAVMRELERMKRKAAESNA
jgi:GTP-binding protein